MYRGFECTVGVRRLYRGFDVCTGGPTCVPGVRRVYRGFDMCTGGSTCVLNAFTLLAFTVLVENLIHRCEPSEHCYSCNNLPQYNCNKWPKIYLLQLNAGEQ